MKDSEEYIDFNQLRDLLGITDPDNLKKYFREIYKDLITHNDKKQKPHITKIVFIEYINLPILISEKLFISFDQDKDGYLNLKEFSKNLIDLYTGSFEEVTSVIFSLLDFDQDGVIIPQDVKLLLQYLPLDAKNEYKFQMASLKEIDGIINELFNGKKELNLTEFIYATENHHSDAFLQILCFLYERKPFTNKSLKLISKKKISIGTSITNTYLGSQLPITPTRKNLPSPNRQSLLSPLRLLDEVTKVKTPNKTPHLSLLDSCLSFSLDDPNGASQKQSTENVNAYKYSSNSYYEDYIYKINKSNKLRKYYVVLAGKDMYYFKNEKKTQIIGMHHLSGCYIKKIKEEIVDKEEMFSFTVQFSNRKRVYYTKTKRKAINWQNSLNEAIGNLNFYDYYEVLENLGEGKFGIVKLCQNKTTGMKVAVKILTRSKIGEIDFELIYNELEIMKLVHHPNIVSLIDLFENSDTIFIVMDYYKGGDLSGYLQKNNYNLSERQLAKLISQITQGISYLHEYGIVHRDLKPDNIMLSDMSDEPKVKIMDFGLSKIMGVNETAAEGYGTLSFVAPEVLLRKPYNREIDIWSIGVMIYYSLTGILPFDDDDDDEEEIAKQTVFDDVRFPIPYWKNHSPEVIDLIRKCLIKEPEKRICIKEILQHKWLRKYSS